jgi:hypothetical protein
VWVTHLNKEAVVPASSVVEKIIFFPLNGSGTLENQLPKST